MNLCYNALPIEEGACTRRPGTLFCATTRNGNPAVLKTFHFSQSNPFAAEFTAGFLRIFAGTSLLLENVRTVTSISTANPAVVLTNSAHGLTTNDQVQFVCTAINGTAPSGPAPLFDRQFVATVVDSTHFSLTDPVTGANIDGSTINLTGWTVKVYRVVTFATSYLKTDLGNLRLVQNESVAFVLDNLYQPKMLANTVTPTPTQTAVFTWTTPTFLDGPYLDPPVDGTTLTPSGVSGTITLTASSIASINGGSGFLSTDVGRLVRLYSQPAAWAVGTAYTKGQNVLYDSVAYQAVANSTGVQPDTDAGVNWVINPSGSAWTWATIATVVDTSHVTATLAAADPLGILAGGSLLNTVPITAWRLGLYSATTGWPSGGGFHEGRFWLFGAIANRLDSNMSNNNGQKESSGVYFSPTLKDGTVADNCGISAIFEGEERNTIFWIAPTGDGIVVGTQGGEWLIQASAVNDPITPTSIQAHRVTKYGCANIEPRLTGLSHVFVQRFNLNVYEYMADVYSRKFTGLNLSRRARHLTAPGIAEIAYQAEKAPVVWSRTTDGRLLGMTYKRDSAFTTQPPTFNAWHQHALGSGRTVECVQAGPSPDGATDSVMLVTNDPSTNIRYVESLSAIPDETTTLSNSWFLDAAVTPASAQIVGPNLILYGLNYIAGKTVTAWIGGVDAGDYVVSASGTVTIPLDGTANGTGGALFTSAMLAGLTGTFANLNLSILVTAAGTGFFSPVGAALDFTQTHSSSAHFAQNFQVACVDWDKQRLYIQSAVSADGEPSSNGRTFYVFNTATQAQLSNASPATMGNTNTACLGYDGHIYYGTGTSAYLIGQYRTDTLVDGVLYNDTHSLPAVGFVAPISFNGAAYVLATGLNSGQGGGGSAPWFVVNMTDAGGPAAVTTTAGFFDEGNGSISPGNAFPCRGPTGSAYVLVVGTLAPGYAGTPQIGVYKCGVDSSTLAGMGKIGVVTPSQVQAGWTSISLIGPPIYDETDGNLIAEVQGSDATKRIVKISTRDATVLWKITVTSAVDFRQSRVRGGRMSFIDGAGSPYTLQEINTLTGTLTGGAPTETSIAPNSFQTDDLRGQVIVEINDIGTQQWATFGPSSAPGAGTITPAAYDNAPALIGFNYTSKGQLLRAVSPQDGFQTGPGQGKLRRAHYAAPFMALSQYVQMGVDFRTMRQMAFKSAGDTVALTLQQLYTGVYWGPVDDAYTRNSMWCWQSTRPYPATVVSVELFHEGIDNA